MCEHTPAGRASVSALSAHARHRAVKLNAHVHPQDTVPRAREDGVEDGVEQGSVLRHLLLSVRRDIKSPCPAWSHFTLFS